MNVERPMRLPFGRRALRRAAMGGLAVFMGFGLLLILDRCHPLALDLSDRFATVVTARDGTPLRAFADPDGIWRYPVNPEDVSPRYIEALLGYEDRWFYRHPGINPLALARAAGQNLSAGRIVSGGSTLTMQVARLLGASSRSLGGKACQMLRALQLEWHLSKRQILTLYLNLAPFGGPIEGIQAASFAYLGKAAAELSPAEAALLAVLPQAPSRFRPDRHPHLARAARDKLLRRLAQSGTWEPATVDDALHEPVVPYFKPRPMQAALLARRLKEKHPRRRLIQTGIAADLQARVERLLQDHVRRLAPGTSAAVMVMDNRSLAVRVYAGSANFGDEARFGYLDMVMAIRSPGSALKPFVYGLALDEGIIHEKSLLCDAPLAFGDYRPANFADGFSGPVSVSHALQRSLNVPAVQVLEQLGPRRFLSALLNAGARVRLPEGADPNLSLALGGLGTSLESLMILYSALGRQGLCGWPRYAADDPIQERRLLSPGAAWIIRRILEESPRPDRPAAALMAYQGPMGWKTGTSYGFRDSWALGVTGDHTIGVWVGRPDGSPLPGYFGAATAAPLLFAVGEILPCHNTPDPQPAEVSLQEICWPLGTLAAVQTEDVCHERKSAWILNGQAPPTFKEPDESGQANPMQFQIPVSGDRADSRQSPVAMRSVRIALWPKSLEAWLPARHTRAVQFSLASAAGLRRVWISAQRLKIAGMNPDAVIRSAAIASGQPPAADLLALGGVGKRFWFVNGKALNANGVTHCLVYHFPAAGRYQIAVVDEQGNADQVSVRVEDAGRAE